jgi:Ca2+-binding RTX toxin-like protein
LSSADLSADNFIDGGLGADIISAGAGDDTIDPGRDVGSSETKSINKIDGGEGTDKVIFSGNKEDWSKQSSTPDGYDAAYENTKTYQAVYLKDVEGIEYDDQFENLKQEVSKASIDNDGDGKIDQYSHQGTSGGDAVTAAVGNVVDVLDTGEGDDVISAGNGADIIIDGGGDDFIFGGANMGINSEGKQDNDKAIFNGSYKTSTNSSGEAVAADYSVVKTGLIAQLSCDPGTGEVCLLNLNDSKSGTAELKDSEITTGKTPTIYADIKDIYVATIDDNFKYDAVTNQNGQKVTTISGVNYVATETDGAVTQFSTGTGSTGFNADTMTLKKASELIFEDSTGSLSLAKDASGSFIMDGASVKQFADADAVNAYAEENSLTLTETKASSLITFESIGEKLDVYEISSGSGDDKETNTVAGVEQLEFNDTVVNLKPEAEKKVSFDIFTGLTANTNIIGSDFSDRLEGTAENELFAGLDGSDIFVFNDNSGVDRISDFKAGEDKISILSGVNGTSINTPGGVLKFVTDTTDGALIDLGVNSNDESQSILLIGVSKEDLSADDFLMTYL